MNSDLLIESLDLDGLHKLASKLVECLPERITIGLVGTLGAGKTTLVQAISSAIGVDRADEDEFLELGVEELFDQEQAWTLIEWADRVEGVMPRDSLWLEIRLEPQPDTRSVKIWSSDYELSQALKKALREMMLKG